MTELSREQIEARYGRVSRSTYKRIEKVLRSGVRELIASMEAADGISIAAAAVIAAEPAWRQRKILELPPKDRRAAVRLLNTKRTDTA